jgi:DNA-directed RNA polymerase subunit beta'
MAHDFKSIGLQDPIVVRLPEAKAAVAEDGATKVETTVGRLLFNEALPEDFPYINETLQSRELTSLVSRVADRYDQTETAEVLNKLKTLGFHWASRAGVTVSIQDVLKPPRKQQILDEFEKRAEKVESQFRRGIITDDERRQELIEIWTEATERVREDMEDRFRQEPFNPIYMMATSGARGNMTQVARSPACAAGRQPQGRHHPAAHQGQLPRGPVGARVLHLDPRRPQGAWPTPPCARPTPAT